MFSKPWVSSIASDAFNILGSVGDFVVGGGIFLASVAPGAFGRLTKVGGGVTGGSLGPLRLSRPYSYWQQLDTCGLTLSTIEDSFEIFCILEKIWSFIAPLTEVGPTTFGNVTIGTILSLMSNDLLTAVADDAFASLTTVGGLRIVNNDNLRILPTFRSLITVKVAFGQTTGDSQRLISGA